MTNKKFTEKTLPDGRIITAPETVDISDPEKFSRLQAETWSLTLKYLRSMGIRIKKDTKEIIKPVDRPDLAFIQAIQKSIIQTLESECDVKFQKTKNTNNDTPNYFGNVRPY